MGFKARKKVKPCTEADDRMIIADQLARGFCDINDCNKHIIQGPVRESYERRNRVTAELIDKALEPIPLHAYEDPGYAFNLRFFEARQKNRGNE